MGDVVWPGPTCDLPRQGELPQEETRIARKIIKDGLWDTAWSRDVPYLNRDYWYIPVFLYGPEKRSFSQNKLLGDFAQPQGSAFSVDNFFIMMMYDKEPVVFCRPQEERKGKVHGEIFLVSPSKLYELDAQYQNMMYVRRSPRLFRMKVQNTKDDYVTTRALMYTAIGTQWEDKLYKMSNVQPFTTNNFTYYVYTKQRDTACL